VLLLALLSVSFAAERQAAINPDCAVLLPASPLTAAGLATPYQLSPLVVANGPCNQMTVTQTTFVQGVIYDNTVVPPTLVVYNPIVVDAGTTPAIPLVQAVINAGAIVGLWFGTNANTLTLLDGGKGGFNNGACVNGLVTGAVTSIFGQFAYCNAQNFFTIALQDLAQKVFTPPPLGVAKDGFPCPTIRDFFIVDQDPSDNVVTCYLITAAGTVALNTTDNIAQLGAANVQFAVNPSDNRLIGAINMAIGCPGWRVPDLNDPKNIAGVYSQATNELHAAAYQTTVAGMSPPSYIPLNDPMARVGNQPSLAKVNFFRQGVGQPMALTNADADVIAFCRNLLMYQPIRMLRNLNALYAATSPDPNVANSLLAFLANRFVQAFGPANLQCTTLLRVAMPMNLTVDGNGRVTGAIIVPYTAPTPSTPIVKNDAFSVRFNFLLLSVMVLLALARLF